MTIGFGRSIYLERIGFDFLGGLSDTYKNKRFPTNFPYTLDLIKQIKRK